MKAGTFARKREHLDVVAFGIPIGSPIDVRLYVETIQAFQKQKRDPRNFVLLVSRGLEADAFEVYQAPFRQVAPLIVQAELCPGERAYWTFSFNKGSRKLYTGDSAKVELRKVERRPD
jgi:hypothetical protein